MLFLILLQFNGRCDFQWLHNILICECFFTNALHKLFFFFALIVYFSRIWDRGRWKCLMDVLINYGFSVVPQLCKIKLLLSLRTIFVKICLKMCHLVLMGVGIWIWRFWSKNHWGFRVWYNYKFNKIYEPKLKC